MIAHDTINITFRKRNKLIDKAKEELRKKQVLIIFNSYSFLSFIMLISWRSGDNRIRKMTALWVSTTYTSN